MLKKGGLTALLLFGMFFGAGNLTFPPQLGFESGGHFWPAIAGFVLSGVGIAILTLIIGTLNPKGYIHEISHLSLPCYTCRCFTCLLDHSLPFQGQQQQLFQLVLNQCLVIVILVYGYLPSQPFILPWLYGLQ